MDVIKTSVSWGKNQNYTLTGYRSDMHKDTVKIRNVLAHLKLSFEILISDPNKKLLIHKDFSSVADPESGAFLTPGSGIRDKSRVGIRIRDKQPGSYFLELRTLFFGLKYLNSLMRIRDGKNSDPGWEKVGSGIGKNNPDPLHWIFPSIKPTYWVLRHEVYPPLPPPRRATFWIRPKGKKNLDLLKQFTSHHQI
jgi:hypothetical protein